MDISDVKIRKKIFEKNFPNLKKTNYKITSPPTRKYNCIAWTARDTDYWWWPISMYWPQNVKRELSLEAFINAYATMGYRVCDNGELEKGFEKIAIFIDNDNIPTHAARQKKNGVWTSKLGPQDDIEHDTLNALEGSEYGHVSMYLKRPIKK